jgi:hypothetical protein
MLIFCTNQRNGQGLKGIDCEKPQKRLRVPGEGHRLWHLGGMEVSPKCPHFLKTRGMVRALQGPKWPEKTKDRGQVVDKINESLGSHGGDRGSKPLGTASLTSRYHRLIWSLCLSESSMRGGT